MVQVSESGFLFISPRHTVEVKRNPDSETGFVRSVLVEDHSHDIDAGIDERCFAGNAGGEV